MPPGLPDLAQRVGDLAGIRGMALAEGRQEPAIVALEHPLDPGIAALGEDRGVEPVAGAEAVMHALRHRLELRRHEPGRLRPGEAERVLEGGGVEAEQLAGRRGRRMGPEDRAGMPAARQHLDAMQRHADARPDLVAGDRRQQDLPPVDDAALLGGGEERRQHHGGAVQRSQRVVVVELEALDEGAVEQRRRGHRRLAAPADDAAGAAALEPRHDVDGGARPRQLRADQGAGDAVERQILAALADLRRDVVEGQRGEPGREPPGRALGIGRQSLPGLASIAHRFLPAVSIVARP